MVAPRRLAPLRSELCSTAYSFGPPPRVAPLRFAPLRLANWIGLYPPITVAPLRLAPLKFDPYSGLPPIKGTLPSTVTPLRLQFERSWKLLTRSSGLTQSAPTT